MEKKQEQDENYNDPEDQEPTEPMYRGRTTKRFILTYEQQRVRNLNVNDILTRMNQLRLESQADKARPILGAHGSQSWRSSSAPGSPPKRVTFFPEFKRGQDMHLDNLEINSMPYGCVRSSSASPPKDRKLFLQTLRVPVYEMYGASSSLYNLSLDGSLTSRSEGWPPMYPPDPLLSNLRSDYPFPRYPEGLGADKTQEDEPEQVGEPEKKKSEKKDDPDERDAKETSGSTDSS